MPLLPIAAVLWQQPLAFRLLGLHPSVLQLPQAVEGVLRVR